MQEQNNLKLYGLLKKFLNRSYELLAGQQTGIYLTRIIFLSTGVAEGAIASLLNPALTFLIIARVLSLLVGLPRIARYQLDRNQENRKKFINNLVAQITYLENSINGLIDLEKKLNNIDNKLNITIQSRGDVTKDTQLEKKSSKNISEMQTLIFKEIKK